MNVKKYCRHLCQASALVLSVALTPLTSCSDDAKREAEEIQEAKPATPAAAAPVLQLEGVEAFYGDSAYAHVQRQVDFGPRVPGSAAHKKALDYFLATLKQYSAAVQTHSWQQTVYDEKYTFSNVIASFNPEASTRIVLCAHWDTRPRADEEEKQENRGKAIPGANDGASGVGVLLELARVMHKNPPPIGVDIVLFDAEDMGYSSDLSMFCLGSKRFAVDMPVPKRPSLAILLDLVGDKEAVFGLEESSMRAAPDQMRAIWALGASINPKVFVAEPAPGVYDDHIPLIEAGIPALDIIDREMVGNSSANTRKHYWHTLDDDMSNISASTLETVGKTLRLFVYNAPLYVR